MTQKIYTGRANNKGTEVPQKQMFNLKRFALFRYTNISIIFEFSKYNSLIFNWFRKWRGVMIGVMEGGLGEEKKAGKAENHWPVSQIMAIFIENHRYER